MSRRRLCSKVLVLSLALAGDDPAADVRMPAIFGDHLLLQQDAKLPV